MDRWRGRVALVTGASSGIGRALTLRLLNQAMHVVACARRAEAMEQIRRETDNSSHVGELMAIRCDVSKEEDILTMFDHIKQSHFRGVDVCINNAGVVAVQRLTDGSTTDWRRLLDVNVLGLSICTREALKSMRERGVDDGHVIHISSIAARTVLPSLTFHSATKHAVRALTEGLRMELQTEGSSIRVTEVCPGAVNTDIVRTAAGQKAHEEMFAGTSLLRCEDVVEAVVYALTAPKHVLVNDVILQAIADTDV